MTRYFFDVRDGLDLFPDEEGVELQSQREAEAEAVGTLAQLARDMAQEVAGQDHPRSDIAIEVRTASGPVFQVALIFATNETALQ
ncbi:DUF6894 family protein [Bradyrhizobium sp. 195]|uniref:DUF6894 family protein n=1 Tax=Bradyrhizobium sp. 195 TaxID=2782662 RepID=UPI0020009603|nr:hypothetical protein [Bradyrhizobium sp. 195]UPK31236.1 hypothetical protein IVB26_39520 [Bradyrhizobium sp. 195]